MESSTTLELNNYEKSIESLGKEISSLYVLCGGLRELIEQTDKHPDLYKEFGAFFYSHYRLSYNEIYHGISRLIDNTKGVLSIVKLLKIKEEHKPKARNELIKIEKDLSEKIEQNETAQKVKNFRDNKLEHTNKQYVLDSELDKKFYEENKLQLDDIEALLHLLGHALQKASERASFHLLTLPVTSIRTEISNLFDRLSLKPEN